MGCWQSHQLVAAGTISSCCPEPHPRKEHLLESAGAGVSGVQSIAVLNDDDDDDDDDADADGDGDGDGGGGDDGDDQKAALWDFPSLDG